MSQGTDRNRFPGYFENGRAVCRHLAHLPLPTPPAGFSWRHLTAADRTELTAYWRILDRHGDRTRLWRGWFGTLIDWDSGGFAEGFLQVVGLFSTRGELVALAAETECLDDPRASETAFVVAQDWQGQRLGRLALRAALVLARRQGSEVAYLEFHPENLPCLNLCRLEGLQLQSGKGQTFIRGECPLRWRHRLPLAWRRLLRYWRGTTAASRPFPANDL